MLITMLRESGLIEIAPGFEHVVYDMSVGYDLEGIRSDRVRAFIEGMMDAGAIVDRLRAEIPDEHRRFRDLDFATSLARSLTLSTFHGCPPDEIERIIDFLLNEYGLDCVIKLNPTLLGPDRVAALMHDEMGYTDVVTPPEAFEKDTKWDQAVGFARRLKATADRLGRSLGVKFSNTLIVRNHRRFFPESEKEMYLSGQPLHVLAMSLVRDWRREFGASIPISFAAGIDRKNFPDAAALGLVPITVCTDLLRPGGYARQSGYMHELTARMDAVGARSIPELVLRAYGAARAALEEIGGTWSPDHQAALDGGADLLPLAPSDEARARWIDQAALINTERYADRVVGDPRYARDANAAVPKKIGSHLTLFDCVTCDKCVPVCPNDANFTLATPSAEIPVRRLSRHGARWTTRDEGAISLAMKHQIANFADLCNECGNCDVFCPEDGGPYIVKPRFFGSLELWERFTGHDGFFMEHDGHTQRVHARFEGREFVLESSDGLLSFRGDGFDVRFDPEDPAGTAEGEASAEVDLTYALIIDELRRSLLAPDAPVTYVNA
jgi:putative selenate reductase